MTSVNTCSQNPAAEGSFDWNKPALPAGEKPVIESSPFGLALLIIGGVLLFLMGMGESKSERGRFERW